MKKGRITSRSIRKTVTIQGTKRLIAAIRHEVVDGVEKSNIADKILKTGSAHYAVELLQLQSENKIILTGTRHRRAIEIILEKGSVADLMRALTLLSADSWIAAETRLKLLEKLLKKKHTQWLYGRAKGLEATVVDRFWKGKFLRAEVRAIVEKVSSLEIGERALVSLYLHLHREEKGSPGLLTDEELKLLSR